MQLGSGNLPRDDSFIMNLIPDLALLLVSPQSPSWESRSQRSARTSKPHPCRPHRGHGNQAMDHTVSHGNQAMDHTAGETISIRNAGMMRFEMWGYREGQGSQRHPQQRETG